MPFRQVLKKRLRVQYVFLIALMLFAFALPISVAAKNFFFFIALLSWRPDFSQLFSDIKNTSLLKWMTFYFGFSALSLLWTDEYYYGFKEVGAYFMILITILMMKGLPKNSFESIVSAFLAGMAVSETISYALMFGLIDQGFFGLRASASSYDPSPFITHIHYSIFLCMAIYMMIIRILFDKRNKREKIIYALFICTMLTNLFFNAGRSGQYAFVVASIVLLVTYFRTSIIKNFVIASVAIGLILSLFWHISPIFKTRVIETYDSVNYYLYHGKGKDDSTGWRFQMWEAGLNVGNDQWLYGHGLAGSYDDYLAHIKSIEGRYSLKDIEHYKSVHNRYIQTYMELGILGLILLFLWFIQFFRNSSRMNLRQVLISRVTGTVFLAIFIVEPLLKSPYSGTLLGLVTAMIVIREQDEGEETT